MEQPSARTTQHEPRGQHGPRDQQEPYEQQEQQRRPQQRHPAEPAGVRPGHEARLPRPAAPAPGAEARGGEVPDADPGAQPSGRPSAQAPGRPSGQARTAAARPARRAARSAPAREVPGEGVAVYGQRGAGTGPPFAPLVRAFAKLPAPKLTGLGTGVFAGLLMALFGGLSGLLLNASAGAYGVFFVLVCTASALWVRPSDLFAAPIVAPLSFTLGLFFVGGPADGVAGQLQNVFTGLALHAGWLYGGTLTAALIALVRKGLLAVGQARGRGRGRPEPGAVRSPRAGRARRVRREPPGAAHAPGDHG